MARVPSAEPPIPSTTRVSNSSRTSAARALVGFDEVVALRQVVKGQLPGGTALLQVPGNRLGAAGQRLHFLTTQALFANGVGHHAIDVEAHGHTLAHRPTAIVRHGACLTPRLRDYKGTGTDVPAPFSRLERF